MKPAFSHYSRIKKQLSIRQAMTLGNQYVLKPHKHKVTEIIIVAMSETFPFLFSFHLINNLSNYLRLQQLGCVTCSVPRNLLLLCPIIRTSLLHRNTFLIVR